MKPHLLARLHEYLATQLEEIRGVVSGCGGKKLKLTLLVRMPGDPRRNILISDDDLDAVVEAVQSEQEWATNKLGGMEEH